MHQVNQTGILVTFSNFYLTGAQQEIGAMSKVERLAAFVRRWLIPLIVSLGWVTTRLVLVMKVHCHWKWSRDSVWRSAVCSGVASLKSLCKHLNFDGERCEYYYYNLNEWIIGYLFILKGKISVIFTEYGQLMWVAPRYSCGFGGLPSWPAYNIKRNKCWPQGQHCITLNTNSVIWKADSH